MADSDDIAYVVRGAWMRCSLGTHPRRINLPVSHGSYSKGQPIMNKTDNVVGKNIFYFGLCKGDCPSSGKISLVSEGGGVVTGNKCQVTILKEWMNAKEDTLVEGKAALITKSVLVCAHGGQITFETHGQQESMHL